MIITPKISTPSQHKARMVRPCSKPALTDFGKRQEGCGNLENNLVAADLNKFGPCKIRRLPSGCHPDVRVIRRVRGHARVLLSLWRRVLTQKLAGSRICAA